MLLPTGRRVLLGRRVPDAGPPDVPLRWSSPRAARPVPTCEHFGAHRRRRTEHPSCGRRSMMPGETEMSAVMPAGQMPSDSDAALIEQSWAEPARFAEVFDRYYGEIHGYASRRLGRSLADDVAAETFLVAFRRRGSYDVAHPVARPWLYGIAANLIAGHRRAEVRQYRALARAGPAAATEGHADRVAGQVDAAAVR